MTALAVAMIVGGSWDSLVASMLSASSRAVTCMKPALATLLVNLSSRSSLVSGWCRQHRRNHRRAGVEHRQVVGVVHFQGVCGVAVQQRGGLRRKASLADGMAPAAAFAARSVDHRGQPGGKPEQRAGRDHGADDVEEFVPRHGADFFSAVAPAKRVRPDTDRPWVMKSSRVISRS